MVVRYRCWLLDAAHRTLLMRSVGDRSSSVGLGWCRQHGRLANLRVVDWFKWPQRQRCFRFLGRRSARASTIFWRGGQGCCLVGLTYRSRRPPPAPL